MRSETNYFVTVDDVALMRQLLPADPCDTCAASKDGSCCGCSAERQYQAIIKPYKDAGIYDYARILRSIKVDAFEAKEILNRMKNNVTILRNVFGTELEGTLIQIMRDLG